MADKADFWGQFVYFSFYVKKKFSHIICYKKRSPATFKQTVFNPCPKDIFSILVNLFVELFFAA